MGDHMTQKAAQGRDQRYESAVRTAAAALAVSYDSGCGTTSRRNRTDPRRQAETVIRTLISLGWTPPAPPPPEPDCDCGFRKGPHYRSDHA